MSRLSETIDIISNTRQALMEGSVDKPALFLIPVLSEIAISLAFIADLMEEKQVEWRRSEKLYKHD